MIKHKVYKIFKIKFFVLVVLLGQILTLSTSKIGAQASSEFIPSLTYANTSYSSLNKYIQNSAQPKTAAQIAEETRIAEEQAKQVRFASRAALINNFLSYKRSPLNGFGNKIAELESKYNVPANLVIAISGTESSFCQINFRPYNCWGWMTGQRFGSYDEALDNYFSYLANYYFTTGLTNPSAIAHIYCPPTPESWANHTYSFMNQMSF